VIEGPQDDARAVAVIAEVKNLAPNKPIKTWSDLRTGVLHEAIY
jgi:hypothetical protein